MSTQLMHKLHNRRLRASRIRSKVVGTAERPRLQVHVSNRHITAQLIDDQKQRTISYVTTVTGKKVAGTMTERAVWVGQQVAKKATASRIKRVVFDRGSKLYHGRVKALADAARNAGLEF